MNSVKLYFYRRLISYLKVPREVVLTIVESLDHIIYFSFSLEYPNTSKASVEADHHSKVMMTFVLLNQVNSEPVTVHQVGHHL